MRKKYKTLGCIILIVILGIYIVIGYIRDGNSAVLTNNEEMFVDEEIEVKDKKIVVEIKGEVNKPNIYWLDEGSIIEDLIRVSGGLTKAANINGINRAQELINHQSIIIPNINDKTSTNQAGNEGGSDGKVNINTANESELDTLPGIGPSRAKDIINYREKVGAFKSIEEIKNVSGIGESAFEKMKEIITI